MRILKLAGAVLMLACALATTFMIDAAGQEPDRPELIVHTGHGQRIASVAFSRDGKTMASASWDKTVKLWNVETGRLIQTFEGHGDFVYSVNFSPDGKSLASGSRDKTVKLWRLDRRAEPLTMHAPEEVQTVVYSADGATVAGSGADGAVRFWDAHTGRPRGEPLPLHTNYAYSLALSGDGRWLASSSLGEIVLWELKEGRERERLKWCSNRVDPVVFSPDSKTLAAGCFDGKVLLWNVETGQRRDAEVFRNGSMSLQFTTDGAALICSGYEGVKLYDVAVARTRELPGDYSRIEAVGVSPDGRLLVSGDADGNLLLRDMASGALVRPFGTDFVRVMSVAFSPDGSMLASGWENGSIRVWGLRAGAASHGMSAHMGSVTSLVFTPDGNSLVSAGSDRDTKLWDFSADLGAKTLKGYSYTLGSEAFTGDGKSLALGTEDGARLFDLATGEGRPLWKGRGDVYSVTLSPDGKRMAVAGSDSVRILNEDGTGGRGLNDVHAGIVSVVRFSPDGTKVVNGNLEKTITVSDLTGAAPPRVLKGGFDWASRFAFDERGERLASLDGDRVRLWDLKTGAGQTPEERLPDWVKFDNLAKLPEFDVLASADGNHATLLRADRANPDEAELARLYGVGEDGWVVVRRDGRFDTNLPLEAIREMSWRMPEDPLRPLPLETFMRDYYEPGLLGRLLDGEEFPKLPDLSKLNRYQPLASITAVSRPDAARRASVKVEVAAPPAEECERRPGRCVYDLRLFRDGRLVGSYPAAGAEAYARLPVRLSREEELRRWRDVMLLKPGGKCRAAPGGGRLACLFDVQLPLGKDVADVELTAYAFNDDRVKSLTAEWHWPEGARATLPRASQVKPKAYVVSFGVNTFADSRWNLTYAANDARLMQEVLSKRLKERQAAGELEEVVEVPLVSDGRSDDATKEKLRAVLELLAGRPRTSARLGKLGAAARQLRKAGPDDIVILSFSTHGYAGRDGVFYLLPSDIATGGEKKVTDKLLQSSISSNELSLWLRGVDADEFIMIVDACQAEAAVRSREFKPGPMGSRGLGQLSYDKGMRILAATQADNVATELGRIDDGRPVEGGLLTFALLKEGIERRMADRESPREVITAGEWLKFGVAEVPRLYGEWRRGTRNLLLGGEAVTKRSAGPRGENVEAQQPSLFDFRRRGSRDTVLVRLK